MFKQMALGKKIGLGFGVVIVFLCAVGVTGYLSMNTATESVNAITAQLEIAKQINTVLTDAQDAQSGSLRLMIYDDDKYYEMIQSEAAAAAEHTQQAKDLMKSEQNRANSDEVAGQINAYVVANQAWFDLQVQRRESGATRSKAADVAMDNIRELLEAQEAAIRASVQETGEGQVADFGVMERTLKAQEVRNTFNRIRYYSQKYQLAKTPAAQDEMAKEWVKEIGTTKELIAECKEVMKNPAALEKLNNCLAALNDYSEQVERFREINRQQRAIQLEQMKPAADMLMAKSRSVRDGVYEFIDNVNEESDESMAFASLLITSIGIGAVIVGILCAIIITRSITGPLNRIISTLNEGADQVNDAASQVSSASQMLAEGASEQASSLEETSAALEEMAAMTRTNAENAKEANGLSGQAKDAAQTGDKTMEKLNSAMGAINESSGQISRIIKVIEEIAFQTNLLALNAAVEAARAGEHGKGFAVVADEVRNLAQRAAQAAGETTSLIEDSVTRAKEGTEVAGDVGKALGAIVTDVTKVTDLIEGISKASEEQAQGVDQVNTAVAQMDKVTQQNASGAEESASASEELSAQALAVKGIVSELSQLVSGMSSQPAGRRPQGSATTPGSPAKMNSTGHSPSNASSHSKAQPVAAGTNASDEFMSMNDNEGVQDF